MISRTHRFHGYNALTFLYKRARVERSTLLTLKYTAGRPARPYRAAVVVSKKVSKSAVVRNRIRRRVFEIIRRFDAGQALGIDIVVSVYNEQVATIGAAELEQQLATMLAKANQATRHAIVNTNKESGNVYDVHRPADI